MDIKKIFSILTIVMGSMMLITALLFGGIFFFVGDTIGNEKDKITESLESFKEDALVTQGTIIDVDNGTTVEYYSEADDSYYEATLSVTNSQYPVGRMVTVYYKENDPGNCMIPEIMANTYGLLNTVFSGIGSIAGALMASIGIILLIVGLVLGKKPKNVM